MRILWMAVIATFLISCNSKQKMVKISTEYGDMVIKLYDETPEHRDNFIKLVNEGFYDSLLFHRVMTGFMIQGGDPDSKGAAVGVRLGQGGPGYTVPADFNPAFIHKKGALAAARQPDQVNPEKASSGSQFYIVQGRGPMQDTEIDETQNRVGWTYTDEQRTIYKEVGGTAFLDNNYTVFGEVVEGMDVIDKIAAVAVDGAKRPHQDVMMTMEVVK